VRAHDSGGGRVAQQRGQQVAAAFERVVEGDGLPGQQDRAVDLVLGLGQRPKAPGVGDQRLAFGPAPQGQRQRAGHQGQHQHHGQAGDQLTQPAAGPRLPLGATAGVGHLMLGRGPAGVQELALQLIEVAVVIAGPVQGAGQPSPPVQLPRLPAGLVPLPRRRDEVALQGSALDILLQPAVQPGPLPQQRLVGHLHGVLGLGQQPLVGQRLQHPQDELVLGGGELLQGHPAADHRLALARPGQPQQDPAGHRLLVRRQPEPGAFGQPGHRPAHPTGLLVGSHG
jgi:hypothetical protein